MLRASMVQTLPSTPPCHRYIGESKTGASRTHRGPAASCTELCECMPRRIGQRCLGLYAVTPRFSANPKCKLYWYCDGV